MILVGCEVHLRFPDASQTPGKVIHAEGRVLSEEDEDDVFGADEWYFLAIREALPPETTGLQLLAVTLTVETGIVPATELPVTVRVECEAAAPENRPHYEQIGYSPEDYPSRLETELELRAVLRRTSADEAVDETVLVLVVGSRDERGER